MSDSPRRLPYRIIASKTFYAVCFCILLPLLIAWGCNRLETSVTLPPLHFPLIGTAIACLSLSGIIAAMCGLKIRG